MRLQLPFLVTTAMFITMPYVAILQHISAIFGHHQTVHCYTHISTLLSFPSTHETSWLGTFQNKAASFHIHSNPLFPCSPTTRLSKLPIASLKLSCLNEIHNTWPLRYLAYSLFVDWLQFYQNIRQFLALRHYFFLELSFKAWTRSPCSLLDAPVRQFA